MLNKEDATALRAAYKAHLDEELSQVCSYVPSMSMLRDQWSEMVWPANEDAVRDPDTGVDNAILKAVGRASVAVPDEFVQHLFLKLILGLWVCRRYTPGYTDTSNTVCKVSTVERGLTGPPPRCVSELIALLMSR
jgi:hypothetical protein